MDTTIAHSNIPATLPKCCGGNNLQPREAGRADALRLIETSKTLLSGGNYGLPRPNSAVSVPEKEVAR